MIVLWALQSQGPVLNINSPIFSVCASLLFGFEGGVWDLIVLNPDHCFSIHLVSGSKEDALTLLNG